MHLMIFILQNVTLAGSCSRIEPSLAFATGTTSKHQRVTWPGLYRKLIEFLRIVVWHMRVSLANLLEVVIRMWQNVSLITWPQHDTSTLIGHTTCIVILFSTFIPVCVLCWCIKIVLATVPMRNLRGASLKKLLKQVSFTISQNNVINPF